VVSERVAVVAAGSVLRGSLRIGRAMAAAVALVDLLYASPGLADASRLIHAADDARLALGLLGAALLVLLGARTIWSGFRARLGLGTAGEVATPRRALATALTTTVFNPLTIALWTIWRQRRGQGRNRPQARTCWSCLAIAACCSPLCRWKCSSTVSGRVRKGRCPAINAGRLRVREPEAGSSWRDAGQARCLQGALPFGSGRRCVRRGSPVAGLPREPRLAEGGEVDDRAADEGRGDLERALAGCDRSQDVGVAR
jgi:hypothetical protein